MKNALIALSIALSIIVVGITFAAPTANAAPNTTFQKESDCQRAKRQGKACEITFGTGDNVEGDRIAPDGDDVYGVMDAFFGGLIRLRLDFRREIIASLDRF